MLVADDILGFNNVWMDQNFFYNITDHINANYFNCPGHQSSHLSCTFSSVGREGGNRPPVACRIQNIPQF